VSHHDALERLVFFNQRQMKAHDGILQALELYGSPAIVSDRAGLRVVVSRRHDVQCLFAMAPHGPSLDVAGMVIYLRTSVEEIVVLHIAVAGRYSRTRRMSLNVVMALLRAVRAAAHRLRGVERLTMLYLPGRPFQISVGSRRTMEPARQEAMR
jgi:hypothetical protein